MRNVLVIGAGTMGQGIVQSALLHGCTVFCRDVAPEYVERGVAAVRANLARMVDKGKLPPDEAEACLARLHGVTELQPAAHCDVAIEAAVENMALKRGIFTDLDAVMQPDCILATNTSSLSITAIAAATRRPDKVVGMHFFNPAFLMPLVEVIRGTFTSDATYDAIVTLTRRLDKTPVTIRESPGFVVNRLLIPMINEAVFLVAEGVATTEDIDEAMRLGANHKLGPLALGDLIGLDVCLAIMELLHRDLGEDKYRPAPLLRKMVDAGLLGRKSGRGFFTYA